MAFAMKAFCIDEKEMDYFRRFAYDGTSEAASLNM